MNKKLFFLMILFLPAIVAAVWFFSMTNDSFTVSNVSSVTFVTPDGTKTEYTADKDKEFFVEFKKNIVSIEDQVYDPDTYSLYELHFERVQGDVFYSLCLSADVKNCLAYDEKGNWYRIDKVYAGEFLSRNNITDVYRNSTVPTLDFIVSDTFHEILPAEATWYYLMADESYSEIIVEEQDPVITDILVSSGEGFEFDFSTEPDWYNVKIYHDTEIIYDGLLDSVTSFSYQNESLLRAVITAEWYTDTTNLYHGKASYELYFDYDLKPVYSLSKDILNSGEVLYISLLNANGEDLEVTSTFDGSGAIAAYPYRKGQLIIVPIPFDADTGEYRINIKSDKTSLSIPFNVNAKNYETVDISFVRSESAAEYSSALSNFSSEISSAFDTVLQEPLWADGLSMPVKKFVDGKERYWVSAPSFGVIQTVDGSAVKERSFGIHYVKSVEADELPIYSACSGEIAFAGETAAYGNTIVIEHGLGFKTVYGHLDSVNFAKGDKVERGALLANADPSGFSVANTEFFFSVCIDGFFVNPYNFITEPRSPADAEVLEPIEFIKTLE